MYKCLLEHGNDRINEKDKIGKKEEAVQIFSFLRSMVDSFYQVLGTICRKDV